MTTLAEAREVVDFLAANVCAPCANAIRRDRADLDGMALALLRMRPRACPEASDLPREERVVSTLAAAVLLVVGIAMGLGWAYLAGGIR